MKKVTIGTLLASVSTMMAVAIAAPAQAQDQQQQGQTQSTAATGQEAAGSPDIVVTGIRASLSSAQSIKSSALSLATLIERLCMPL